MSGHAMLELPGPSRARSVPKRLWLWLLAAGMVVWALATAITAVTRDTILVPTVIMVGSFLVPVTMVAFALSRRHEHRLTAAPADRRRHRDVRGHRGAARRLDASYGWAIMITKGLGGTGWTLGWPNTEAWIGGPTGGTLVVCRSSTAASSSSTR